jgi:hypothetical protein
MNGKGEKETILTPSVDECFDEGSKNIAVLKLMIVQLRDFLQIYLKSDNNTWKLTLAGSAGVDALT